MESVKKNVLQIITESEKRNSKVARRVKAPGAELNAETPTPKDQNNQARNSAKKIPPAQTSSTNLA
jgi:hypothetical protein